MAAHFHDSGDLWRCSFTCRILGRGPPPAPRSHWPASRIRLDGYYARKLGQTSRLGAFLDPVADKLIVAAALVLIVSKDPRWFVAIMAIVIIGREIAVSALREWMAEIGARGRIKVSVLAKYKTIMQIVGLSLLLYREDLFFLPIYNLGLVLTAIAAVLTLWSMISYLRLAWPELRGSAEL